MKQHGRVLRATTVIDSDDIAHHKPVYSQIIHRTHEAGLAGASFFRGLDGLMVLDEVEMIRYAPDRRHR